METHDSPCHNPARDWEEQKPVQLPNLDAELLVKEPVVRGAPIRVR
jgi:hypothetical protein